MNGNCYVTSVGYATGQLMRLGFDPVHYLNTVSLAFSDLGAPHPAVPMGSFQVAAAERGGDKIPAFTPATAVENGLSGSLA